TASFALAAPGIVSTFEAVTANADAPFAVFVVTAFGLADAATAVAAFAVPVTAALSAVAAFRLVVVAAVQAVAAGAVQVVGGGEHLAPVTGKTAAAFALGDAFEVARFGGTTDFIVVAGRAAPVFVAGF